jgi:DNA-binding transcriptional LysR family regulator
LLPHIIGNFVTQHPHVHTTLSINNTEQIIHNLLKFNIDIGMIEGNCYSNEIEVLPWKKDELIIIASAKHLLTKKRKMTLEHLLQNNKWILREQGSGTREKFEEAISGKIKPFLELGNTEAIKQAVLSGVGISCLSKIAVSDFLKTGQLIELKTPFLKLTRNFYIILHKDKYKTFILDYFIKACRG